MFGYLIWFLTGEISTNHIVLRYEKSWIGDVGGMLLMLHCTITNSSGVLFLCFTTTCWCVFPNMHFDIYFFGACQAFLRCILLTSIIAFRSMYFGS